MVDKQSEYQLKLIDKYKESINVYWGALLTINGLLLTFFSIDSLSSSERWIILNYMLVGLCVLSLWLLIWNFKTDQDCRSSPYISGRTSCTDSHRDVFPDIPARAAPW